MVKWVSFLWAALGLLGLSTSACAAAAPESCPNLVPSSLQRVERRSLRPSDLVRLRDIGPVGAGPHGAPLFALSPSASQIAFQLRRADPVRNSYCLAMLVMDLRPGATPRLVDQGGDLIRIRYDFRGMAAFPTGIPKVITPRWSSDGSWIAFLKRSDGVTQVWRANADGSGSVALTQSAHDVEDFRIGSDGTTIVFATRPDLAAAQAAILREGLTGFHYDERFSPASRNRPFPPAPIPRLTFALDLATGTSRRADTAEAALLGEDGEVLDLTEEAVASNGRHAWLKAASGGGLRLVVADRDGGGQASCVDDACMGRLSSIAWRADGEAIRFLRREGAARASSAIYEWVPETRRLSRLYLTDDLLVQCTGAGERLLCLREGSTTPRRFELLDPVSGRRDLLFDPNPEFGGLTLGRIERLHWTNEFGLAAVGDLVLPIGYRPGRRYPLIVVQYDTRGFLRGGTGDEYPIQAFANRGYAVLSVSRPASIGEADPGKVPASVPEPLLDRRSLASSLEAGVDLAIARGIADPARIGITGMSNGATAGTYALLHKGIFSAAAFSNCCIDTTLPTRVGPGAARHFYAQGYPPMIDRDAPFWRKISLALNARQVTIPILLQLPDSEYMSALESFTALRETGAPADMYVFPDEQHLKWQPAHRLAVYERALDWFDYWLRGIRSNDPGRQGELAYWDSLRGASEQGTIAQEPACRSIQ